MTTSLASQYPDLATEWHPTRNDKTPETVAAGSSKKAWWKCSKGPDHEWEATLNHRISSGSGCPFCAGQQVSVTNSLTSQFPELAAEWHPTKNGDLTPDKVVAGSNKKAWWKCSKGPDHEWEAVLSGRTSGGRGCPLCNSGWTVQSEARDLSKPW